MIPRFFQQFVARCREESLWQDGGLLQNGQHKWNPSRIFRLQSPTANLRFPSGGQFVVPGRANLCKSQHGKLSPQLWDRPLASERGVGLKWFCEELVSREKLRAASFLQSLPSTPEPFFLVEIMNRRKTQTTTSNSDAELAKTCLKKQNQRKPSIPESWECPIR